MNNTALEELDKAIYRARVDYTNAKDILDRENTIRPEPHPMLATYYYNWGKVDRLLFFRDLIEIDRLYPLVENANRSRHMAKSMVNPDKLPPCSKEYYQGVADGDAEALNIARKYIRNKV